LAGSFLQNFFLRYNQINGEKQPSLGGGYRKVSFHKTKALHERRSLKVHQVSSSPLGLSEVYSHRASEKTQPVL